MQTNEKILRSIIGSLENKVWLFWKVVLCRAVIFISIGLLFMAATSLWKRILVKVSIIYPESSHTLFYSIGCISIMYRESSNVFFFLECLSLKCFRHSVQAQDWGETKLGFFNINRILTIGQKLAFSLAELGLDCAHIHDGCYHGKSKECIDVTFVKVRDEVKGFDFMWIICFNNFQ